MAGEYQKPTHGYNSDVHENESSNQGEIKDRGMFDFLSKKKESSEEECKPAEAQHHDYKPDHCEESQQPEPYQAKVDDYEEEVKPAEHHHHQFGHHDEECKPEVEEHVYISEPPCEVEKNKSCVEEEKKPSLLEKLHRSHSNSSSSSSSDEEEEVMEDGVLVKKKKKSLKEKLKEKLHKKEEEKKEHCEDTSVPIEKCDEPVVHHHEGEEKKAECDLEVVHSAHEGEEKKGFMEKLKEKFPAKKCEEDKAPVEEPVHPEPHHEVKEEKKGFLEKIKEKFSKNDDECKEKEKEKETPAASHY